MSINPYQAPTSNVSSNAYELAPNLWNPDAAGVWSIFLTPIFGSILISKNWKALGELERHRSSNVWLGVSVLLVITSTFAPFLLFPYIIVWYFSQNRPQTKYLKEKYDGVYPKNGWLKPILIVLAVFIAFLFLSVLL